MALVTHDVLPVALHEATRERYLNYALSVITSRALPDVRDGLKPVQRRILYAMYHNLRLLPDGRYRKSAAVVGEVMAKYHPHGDSSIYEALVRMAQPFSLRHPLVDGQGNFGSLDGDNAAAMRYTECKLRPLAVELLSEIKQRTVDFRPNYDGQHVEPEVLPAQFPQLLVNGSEGIAVGMATRIPPHNLREVIDACVLLIYNPDATPAMLARKVKGPDFPTGGLILNSREELREIYQTGSGAVRTRGVWTTEKVGRKHHVIISEIPYSVNKASLVEKIGNLIAARKIPQLTDVRDESTDVVRIVLELRKAGDEHAAMAFLCKHTPLQTNFHVNLTCLIPTERSSFPEPKRCDIQQILRAWLDFRYETVRRRFQFQLDKLKERIHILQGFAIVFDCLDEAIRIIRASEGKRDAAEQLMVRFDLDDVQAEAILELRLYKLAQLEILAIRDELEEKLAEATRIEAILASSEELWSNVREELLELRKLYGEKRRTQIGGVEEAQVLSYSEDDYIVAEDAYVIVTRDGWMKRQGRFTEIEKIRIRDGDEIGWIARASTRSTLTIFTDQGVGYSLRVDDVPSTTGYGEPVQRHFNFSDGERVVGVVIHDAKALPDISEEMLQAANEENPAPPHGLALSRKGRTLRFPLTSHASPSNKNGRRYMRPDGADDGVFATYVSDGTETLSIASVQGRAICFEASEVKIIRGSGKGVMGIKLRPGDRVMAFELTREKFKGATVTTSTGREEVVRPSKFAGKRGGRGRVVLKRGSFVHWDSPVMRYDLSEAALEPEEAENEQQQLELGGTESTGDEE